MSIPDTSTTHLLVISRETKQLLVQVARKRTDAGDYTSFNSLVRDALDFYIEKKKLTFESS